MSVPPEPGGLDGDLPTVERTTVSDDRFVANLMEALGLNRDDAEAFIAKYGEGHAAWQIRDRWLPAGESPGGER